VGIILLPDGKGGEVIWSGVGNESKPLQFSLFPNGVTFNSLVTLQGIAYLKRRWWLHTTRLHRQISSFEPPLHRCKRQPSSPQQQ